MKLVLQTMNRGLDVKIVSNEGFGSGCASATEVLEGMLGRVEENTREYTKEYTDGEDNNLTQSNG